MRLFWASALVACLGVGVLAQSPVMSPGSRILSGETTRLHHSPSQTVLAVWFPFEIMAAWTKEVLPNVTDQTAGVLGRIHARLRRVPGPGFAPRC